MTRLMFLIVWLRGPGTFRRLALFYVVGMLFLFYCLIGGLHCQRWPRARNRLNLRRSNRLRLGRRLCGLL